MHFTVNITVNDAIYSTINCKIIHFTVYLTVKLHRHFNCNVKSIYIRVYKIRKTIDITIISNILIQVAPGTLCIEDLLDYV